MASSLESGMAYDLPGLFIKISRHLKTVPYLTLEDLSKQIRVERHTIEKAVKQATGRTFRETRNRILLEHAQGLLEMHPDRSIKEVAFELGYRSQRSFSRFIRTSVGCSPKEFRRGMREKAS
jgi:AraC-like DNA-binding protein